MSEIRTKIRRAANRTVFRLLYPKIRNRMYKRVPQIMSIEETLQKIVNEGLSISRFGDGEFGFLLDRHHESKFQETSLLLSDKLKEIVTTQNPNCLVCLNYYISFPIPKDHRAYPFWSKWKREKLRKLVKHLDKRYVYGNANLFTWEGFEAVPIEQFRNIWRDRDLLIVTGKNSTFILDDRLFSSSRSINILYTRSHSAFREYSKILDEIKKFPSSTMILFSAGMAATCWAWELSTFGYQCIDIGHIANYFLEHIGEAQNIEEQRRLGVRREFFDDDESSEQI